MIDEKDIYDDDKNDFGYETESHITLLYGIHPKEINKEEIFEYLKSIKSLELEIDNVSIFEKKILPNQMIDSTNLRNSYEKFISNIECKNCLIYKK